MIRIRNVHQSKVHIYSLYNQIESLVLICYELIKEALIRHFVVPDLFYGWEVIVPTTITIALRALCNLYCTHVVWSVDLRLQNNETVVLHGKETSLLIRNQAGALALRGFEVSEPGKVQEHIGIPVQHVYGILEERGWQLLHCQEL